MSEAEAAIEDVTGVVEPESGLPALREPDPLDRPLPASPAVQAAAVAATSLVAGAVTVAAVRRMRSTGLPSLRRSRRARPLKVVTSRSFLVDVHLLDRR